MRDPFLNKSKNELIEKEELSLFDYSDIKEDDKIFLIEKEQEIKNQAKIFQKTTLNIGKILYEANEKLANYHKGKYMEWCESLNISKDQSSYFLKRYNLFLEYKDKKELIEKMPNQLVRVLTAKTTDESLKQEALKQEVTNIKQFNELKREYSALPNTKKSNKINELEDLKILLNIRNKGNMDLEELKVLNNILSEIEKLKYRCLNKTL